MTSDNVTKLTNISFAEQFILDSKSHSPVSLGCDLNKLRGLRKDLYVSLIEESKFNEHIKKEFVDEYDEYCKFNTRLISTKKLSNSIFFEILHGFLRDYDMVEPLDIDKTAYRLTLRTLDYLRVGLKNSDGKMNYRLRGVNKLLKQFIKNNSPHKEEQDEEKTL